MFEERRDGRWALVYLRQRGACLLTVVTTRREGWGVGVGQHGWGWLVLDEMSKGKVGERHKEEAQMDKDNEEKPGAYTKHNLVWFGISFEVFIP